MEFIDHTGHIFSLPTFDDKPVAIQYTESDYIFWIKDNPVSINNYYILPIRFLLDYDIYVTNLLEYLEDEENNFSSEDLLKINIILNSNFYKLIGPKYIQSKLEANKDINEPIEFDLNDFKSELTLDDFYFELSEESDQNLIVYNSNKKFIMFPFYVIGKSDEEGTYLSNILINIKTYNQENEKKQVVWLNQDQMYDYLMKKTFDGIKIYEVNPETGIRTLWYDMKSGYDPSKNEIITIHQSDYRYRIRNWSFGYIRSDVYHYIYKLPQEKWLLPNHQYVFEGYVKQSCHYCGSTLIYNHDGYMTGEEYNRSYKYWVPTKNCLLDLDGKPFYQEAYDYNEETGEYEPKEDQLFHYGTVPSSYQERHMNGDDFNFIDKIFVPDTTIRDFFFDVDNKDITENTDGGYVEYKYYKEKNEYTQITVGCTFIDECEELIINGKNMGINLPKEILKAIYNSSFYNKYADERLLKNKMKELLLNYMSIKGECGNFKSVINSLKWFGWADKIEISKLIKTDNEFQNQYILDYFTITTDLKETYKYFNTTNLISLSVKGNQETGEYDIQDYSKLLIGEGKPLLEDLFEKNIEVKYDELKFYKPYYDFLFNELALKLDCLSYYWQKYFLPIHLKINRASIEYKVYANDMKLSSAAFSKIIAKPIITHIDFNNNHMLNVVFPESQKVIFNKSIHYIDKKFNEFSNYNDSFNDEDLYYVNENCIVIPIKIEDLYNQYSLDNYGEYFLIDEEYRKPFKFFKLNDLDNYLEEVNNLKEANYYQLYYNSDYTEITGSEKRYSKITTEYYSCKIFLSYFDNETNEEKYLVKNNAFNFYQNVNQYYCNYVIVPRLIEDKSFDWLNTKFRLTIVVNNKWSTYDFTIQAPNIYLELGKLDYIYYIGEDVTMFKQFTLKNNNIKFNSFLYQPDLVSIDTLFYDKSNDKVLTFIQKLIETEGDQNKIYEFYKQYYQKSIEIPFNPKYYNKIHIFDIYSSKYNGKGFNKVIIAEYFGWHTWTDEWSEYNGGKQNVIKGWGHLVPDFWQDYPNGQIKFYKKNNNMIVANSSNLNSQETWQSLIIDNGYTEKNISHIELIDDDGNIVYDLKYIEGELFKDLRLIDNTDNMDDDPHVSHEHRKIWWYDEMQDNNSYEMDIDPTGKLLYSGEEILQDLYSNFFNLNTSNLLQNIEEDCEYDAYLMHDEPKENGKSYWYMVLISRYPINNYTKSELSIHKETYKFNDFWIKYSGYSFDKFLINRMDIIPSNGYNHFNPDDLIIATINNNNYQFNIDLSSKWTINYVNNDKYYIEVQSNTNMIIIPNYNIDNLYKPGYYNIKLNYTINGLNDQLYIVNGRYFVNNTIINIKYPIIKDIVEEVRKISFENVISDFSILYENIDGSRKTTPNILRRESGYIPIGIKIVNAGYFAPDSPDIYMGLKLMDCYDPDNGYSEEGSTIYHIVNGVRTRFNNPYWGFYNLDLNELLYFNKICYTDESKSRSTTQVYPQTDDFTKLPSGALDSNGNPKYPAPNKRAFRGAVGSSNYYVNLLNVDDTLNTNMFDETCSISDWNGKLNTEKIINQFDEDRYPDWRTIEHIPNEYNYHFSPSAACCWRYHTLTTNQGDWYLPAFAEVFFVTYNFKKYSEVFKQLSEIWPEYCKLDLISCIGSSALWSSTSASKTLAWEIHPCQHAHSLSKSTTGWYTIPFIHINK